MAPKPPVGSPSRIPGTGNFNGISPVLLSSACNVLANNSAIPQSNELSYAFRKAIVIEEIRFDLRLTGGVLGQNLGSAVSVRLTLGQKFLMRDPIPVWLLGTEMAAGTINGQEQALDQNLSTDTSFSHYRWRLPKPLYVEAGQVLAPVFSRGNDNLGTTINTRISYAGRTVAPNQPVPSVIAVPYVARFITNMGDVYDQSNENDLENPFDYPLQIQRLTGRLLSITGNAAAAQQGLTPATAGSAVTILMNDSWGGKMVNNNTGPGDIFDNARAAWTVDTLMPGKGQYEARVWNIPTTQQVQIAMIGHRDEVL